jgi:hypothetical protein
MKRVMMAALAALTLVWAVGAGVPRAAAPEPRLNVMVVCVKCIPEDMPQEAYNAGNILLDQTTGDLWFYPALSPGVKPRKLGTIKELGQPLLAPERAR